MKYFNLLTDNRNLILFCLFLYFVAFRGTSVDVGVINEELKCAILSKKWIIWLRSENLSLKVFLFVMAESSSELPYCNRSVPLSGHSFISKLNHLLKNFSKAGISLHRQMHVHCNSNNAYNASKLACSL